MSIIWGLFRILTNSLGSNDEMISNSAYKYKRIPVLEAGPDILAADWGWVF